MSVYKRRCRLKKYIYKESERVQGGEGKFGEKENLNFRNLFIKVVNSQEKTQIFPENKVKIYEKNKPLFPGRITVSTDISRYIPAMNGCL